MPAVKIESTKSEYYPTSEEWGKAYMNLIGNIQLTAEDGKSTELSLATLGTFGKYLPIMQIGYWRNKQIIPEFADLLQRIAPKCAHFCHIKNDSLLLVPLYSTYFLQLLDIIQASKKENETVEEEQFRTSLVKELYKAFSEPLHIQMNITPEQVIENQKALCVPKKDLYNTKHFSNAILYDNNEAFDGWETTFHMTSLRNFVYANLAIDQFRATGNRELLQYAMSRLLVTLNLKLTDPKSRVSRFLNATEMDENSSLRHKMAFEQYKIILSLLTNDDADLPKESRINPDYTRLEIQLSRPGLTLPENYDEIITLLNGFEEKQHPLVLARNSDSFSAYLFRDYKKTDSQVFKTLPANNSEKTSEIKYSPNINNS